ncbi:MAG TPA: hypothetical protein DCP53_02610 [Elusimicrobia bacterium]|nr:hypothetical protein [Elusimicrobiota bacterium]
MIIQILEDYYTDFKRLIHKLLFVGLGFILTFNFLLLTCLYSASISVQRIGSIDMVRILDEYPEAKAIKEELSTNLKIKKDNIKTFQEQIETIENEIDRMEEELIKYQESVRQAEINEMAFQTTRPSLESVETSSETIVTSTQTDTNSTYESGTDTANQIVPENIQISSPTFTVDDIDLKKKNLKKQKEDLEKYIKETKIEEREINKKARKNMLGKLYDAIKEVANEEGLAVIIDSSNMIYGEDAEDITEKVLQKLR